MSKSCTHADSVFTLRYGESVDNLADDFDLLRVRRVGSTGRVVGVDLSKDIMAKSAPTSASSRLSRRTE